MQRFASLAFVLALLTINGAVASTLNSRQSNVCNSQNACTAPGGCTGTCAPVTPEGGPPVCANVCGEGESIFCAACYAGNAEGDGWPCQISASGDCTLVS